ncbi:hypothetical protein Oweho_0939 [Owenweeksia hongkongensis DSM 17368]|uniref:Zinc metalloprotease (Elastase) n=1 Tax=Owenweeksia hongkongensis (strain DSM 17368 / CIP 108786 / JCM 12287 / NRRL B-23963 / UST20020801) TaxID=926562 RepID=G8R3C8_OWEHD|nr:T9SS type A sorting domain-containing protein [Owenweeksia hongkongensis]AEV31949.1 hypothetical protein Oweho_0939 [Owenweeksia hongkongensis DSM 17368]
MKLITATLLLLTFSAFSQKAPTPLPQAGADIFLHSYKSTAKVYNYSDEAVKDAIISEAKFIESVDLELSYKVKSKALTHYHFDVLIEKQKIYAAPIHASLDSRGKLRIQNIPNIPQNINGSFPSSTYAENIQQQIGAEKILQNREVFIYLGGDELTKARLIELSGPETLHRNVVIVGNEIVAQQDLHKYHSATGPNDSIVSVSVFDPDPLTTAKAPYSGAYTDNNDKNSVELEAELKSRNTTFTFQNGLFLAENDFVKIADFSLPSIPPVASATPHFHFTRDSASFEDVNVMYHITHHREHLIDLGYPNLPAYQIQIDPHALQGSDQSFFTTNNTPHRIYMGEGGVDDAEDADVILHEFSHAVIYAASPSTQITIERGCIEEALCDYFAASYSASISEFNSSIVFNWDSGNGTVWSPVRSVESTKDYGFLSFKTGSYYSNTDIFASCLMSINKTLGRNLADELAVETLFNLTHNTNMPDFAGYMMMADTLLYNGSHSQVIHDAFMERNIVPSISLNEYSLLTEGAIKISNTYGFGKGEALQLSSPTKLTQYEVYSVGGQLISKGALPNEMQADLDLPELNTGVYLITISTQKGYSQSFRVIRF